MSDQQIKTIYPLTALQQGILFHSINEPDRGVFIDQVHFDIQLSDSQVNAFKQSWIYLLDRHDVLRTAFIWKQIKQPVQVVKTTCEPEWYSHDYSHIARNEQQSRFAQLLLADRIQDFDLANPPLCRQHLVKISDQSYRLLWTFHHLILDGWSVANLFAELKSAYGYIHTGRTPQFNTARPFSDFIDYLQKKPVQASNPFWTNYLQGFEQPTSFCTQKIESKQSMRLGEQDIKFSHAENSIILDFARQQRLSINTLVHAAWSMLLMTYSGCDDVLYGATFSGRDPQLKGIEKMVGVFINTLPVRITRHSEQGVANWLQAIQRNLNQLKEHEHSALTQIKRCSEIDAQTSLFDCLLVVENYPNESSDDTGLNNTQLKFDNVTHIEQSNYPCVLLMLPYSPIQFRLIYDANCYADHQVMRLLAQLRQCLLSLCDEAEKAVVSISVLPSNQAAEILQVSLDRACSFNFETPVHHKIESLSHSTDIAITAAYGDVSYAQLSVFTDSLAKQIRQQIDGLYPRQTGDCDAPIAIYLSRRQRVVESMLAVLKAGRAYVVIDPDYPGERISYLLQHSNAAVCITSSDADLAAFNQSLSTIFIDQIEQQSGCSDSAADRLGATNGDSLAYVLYTSGSSGRPKGVKISHANLAYSTQVRSRVYPANPTVYLLMSAFVFDSSVAGIYWTLTTAGRLIISEPRLEQDMQSLIDQIYNHGVTHTLCLPGLFELILQHAKASGSVSKLQSLTTVILAGEAIVSTSLLPLQRQLLPGVKLYNEYGPTEATVWSSVTDISQHQSGLPVPIGKAIAATQIIILDQFNRLVPFFVPGEICIAGPGVSQGYLDAAELTREQFIDLKMGSNNEGPLYTRFYKTGDLGSMDADATITYLGRIDDQIKIRGHRLEPAEIEQALQASTLVDQAVALSVEISDSGGVDDIGLLSESKLDEWLAAALAKLPEIEARELLEQVSNVGAGSTKP